MNIAGSLTKRVPGLLALVFSFDACAQQTVEVTIRDYKFLPAEVRIHAGDTVKWTNQEKRTSHSVLFPAENGLESERLFPGESWQRSFTVTGTHAYRCGPHEEMKGVVHVD
ncbi:MAG: cupredoxin domain-containing protein [Rhodocyclales bacterium]|nr:cupredoxin domain-containing protein [Rhodocyclales bacterium]